MNPKQRNTPTARISYGIGFLAGTAAVGALLHWYNHVLVSHRFAYWQWCVIAVALVLLKKSEAHRKLIRPFMALLFITILLAQVAAWVGMLKLPLLPL